jgi:hypothetical protein
MEEGMGQDVTGPQKKQWAGHEKNTYYFSMLSKIHISMPYMRFADLESWRHGSMAESQTWLKMETESAYGII